MTKFLTLAALLLTGWSSRADTTVASGMMGRREGKAQIIVSWCRQTDLRVTVKIEADGNVTGTVGDATLINGRFKRNRGWLGRKLNLATDYIIEGKLCGPVVAAEGITRKSVSIPLNFIGGAFVGGVHTSGSKFGGKGKMRLSASGLTLRHSE